MNSKHANDYYDEEAYDNGYDDYDPNLDYANNYNNPNNYQNNNNNYYYYYDNNQYDNYNYNYNNAYSNQYGNIAGYYNNYPMYASVPSSASPAYAQAQANYDDNMENYKYTKKTSTASNKSSGLKGKKELVPKSNQTKPAIILDTKKQDICHARPPNLTPGVIACPPGVPEYAKKPPK